MVKIIRIKGFIILPTRTKYSFINLLASSGARFFTLFLAFLVRTVLIQFLGKEYLGVESVVTSFMQMLNISELGLGSAIIFRLYKPLKDNSLESVRKYLNFLSKAYIIIGVVIIVAGFIFSFFIPSLTRDVSIESSEIFIIYWLYVIQMASSYWVLSFRHAIVQADQKGYIITSFSTLGIMIGSFGQIAFYIFAHNYIFGLAFSLIIQTFSGFLASIYTKKKYPFVSTIRKSIKLTKIESKNLFKDIYALSLTKICKVSNKSVPTVVASAFTGAIQAGFYSNYQLIMNSIDSLLTVAFSSITASIGNLNATENKELKIDAFNKLNFIMFLLLNVCACSICTLTNPFIELVWGESYLLSEWIVLGVSAYIIVSGFLLIIGNFKEAGGIFWQGRYRPLIGCILNIILAIIFMNHWGLSGLIWTITISRVFTELWFDPILVHKYVLECKPFSYFRKLVIYIGTISVSIILSYIICSFFPFQGLFEIVSNLVVSVLTPLIISTILFHKSKEFIFIFGLFKTISKSMFRR